MNNKEVERYFEEYILPPRGFIYCDIKREIDFARCGVGGGNFLSALGLLCYTEFMGNMLLKGQGSKTKQFNAFFKLMGGAYEKLIEVDRLDIYGVLRCGMTHTYFAHNCIIKMENDGYHAGIVIQNDGRYLFIVEKYFEDFICACTNLYNDMVKEENPYLLST